MTCRFFFPTSREPRISPTSNTPRLPRALRLAQALAQSWEERWAGWLASERWRFLGLECLSRRGRSWQLWRAQRAAGGLTGALIGMGIPEYEAKRYEGKVKDGNILLSVHTEDSKERERAKKIFETGGAMDISSTGEASVPKEQRLAAH